MHRYMLTAVLFCAVTTLAGAAQERPNFVIMMTDDQRWDAMSCAGNRILKTPNMDRIAKEGMRFKNMFVVNALCAPSRATLLSGTYSHTNGVIDNKNRTIKAELPLISDLLRDAGYEVAFCGKSHMGGALRERKWDYYFGYKDQGSYLKPVIAEGTDGKDIPYQGYMDDVVTDKAVEWMRKPHAKPFCLFLFFKAPHRSWNRAPRHVDLYKDVTIKPPETYAEFEKGYPGKPQAFIKADNKIGSAPDVPDLNWIKDWYATLVAVDENVGKVFDTLTETKQLDNTVLLYTGDNGFFLGDYKLFDKRLMHEPSIRVPLLVRFPKIIEAGALNENMVLNVDIAPTVLDLAGVAAPKHFHGKSVVPLLKQDKDVAWRKDWLYEYFEFPGPHSVPKNRGVRTDRYKLIHYYEEPQEFELYDLKKDPQEKKNLYGDPKYAELTEELKQRIVELRKETGDQ